MIKVTYYVGTYDKDTCRKKLSDKKFIELFDDLFYNYTLQKAQGVYTMSDSGEVVRENTFIVTTFLSCPLHSIDFIIADNVKELKNALNQESILVEIQQVSAYLK